MSNNGYNQTHLAHRRAAIKASNVQAKETLRFDAAPLIQQITAGNLRDVGSRYGALADTAKKQLAQFWPAVAKLSIEGSAASGTTIIARVLAAAPHAYKNFCERMGIELSVDGLSDALKQSTETPQRLTNLPIYTNNVVEEAFGLLHFNDPTTPFNIAFEDTWRGPLLITDDVLYSALTYTKTYQPSLPKYMQRCPAHHLVNARVWPAMIELAAAVPALFAHDLGLLEQASALAD